MRKRAWMWIRAVAALLLADLRRRLNLTVGAGSSGRRRRRSARLVVCAGAAAAFGALVVLGRTLGTLAPPSTVSGDTLAAWTWAPAVLWAVHQLMSVEPGLGRALVRPPDESVLRSLPISRGQVVAARLVLPVAGTALALLLAVGAVVVPWLAATPAGREVLPLLMVNLAGVVMTVAVLRVLLVAAFMVRVVRVAHIPRVVLSVAVGCLLGILAAPFVRVLGEDAHQAEQRLARALGDAVTGNRPQLWTALHEQDQLAWTTAGYAMAVLGLLALAVVRVRGTARRDETDAAVTYTHTRASTPADRPAPRDPTWRLTWLRLRRGHPETVGGLARLQRLSILTGTVCATVVALGNPLWQLHPSALGGIFVAAALITTSEVVQVCGIEADRGWDLLRQTPGPTGAWPVGKALTSAVTVGAVIGPFCLGAAALGGVSSALEWTAALLALVVVSVATGTATVLTHYCVPRAEGFEGGRISRGPSAEIVDGVFIALFTLPVTAGAGLCATLLDGSALPVAQSVLLVVSLMAAFACLGSVRTRDLPTAWPTSLDAQKAGTAK
ncbi:hypothetical protein [Streptomyces sp. NBC_00286]|uniref:hypothetical protein n=1 Tax=Streptomyces sp. NBC_00286 TaxID=2975701 RepID=UPI002E2815E1|nr:hypothetical protein [Streptomyces sp. NBC_00286]